MSFISPTFFPRKKKCTSFLSIVSSFPKPWYTQHPGDGQPAHYILTNTLFCIHNTDILVNRKFVLILLLHRVKTYDVHFLSKLPPGAGVLPEAASFWQKFSSVQCQKKQNKQTLLHAAGGVIYILLRTKHEDLNMD